MNTSTLLAKLVDVYNLKENYANIVDVLLAKDLTAEEIVKKTKVSSGRIYRLLAELEAMGLIEKISGKPATYSTRDFPEKVCNFLNYSFNEFIEKQTTMGTILADVEEKAGAEIIYGSREKYDLEIMAMLKEGKWAKILHKDESFPWFIYLHDRNVFLKVREKIKQTRAIGSSPIISNLLIKRENYLSVYQSKKVDHIMSQQAFDSYIKMLDSLFGEAQRKEILKDLMGKFEEFKNVTVDVLDNLYNPFSTYITDKQIFIVFFFENNKNRILKLTGQELVETYTDSFGRYQKNSKSIVPLLQKFSL